MTLASQTRVSQTLNAQAADWLDARGLDPELAAKMGWAASRRSDGTV